MQFDKLFIFTAYRQRDVLFPFYSPSFSLFCSYFFLFPSLLWLPLLTLIPHFLSATSTASLWTAFSEKSQNPFLSFSDSAFSQLLSPSLAFWPRYHILHELNVAVAYFCSLFFCRNSAELMNKQAQCTFLHFKSYIIAARSALHTKLHLIKYINMLQLCLVWHEKLNEWLGCNYSTNSKKYSHLCALSSFMLHTVFMRVSDLELRHLQLMKNVLLESGSQHVFLRFNYF